MAIETPGFVSRVAERVVSFIALGLVIAAGIGLWQMGPEAREAWWAAIWRTLVWLAVAAALPWVAQLFIGRLLEVGENWVGIALLGGLLVVEVLVGVLLLTAWPTSVWAWLAAIALLGVATAYNYLVAEYLAQRAGG
jgi:hypothetical protein